MQLKRNQLIPEQSKSLRGRQKSIAKNIYDVFHAKIKEYQAISKKEETSQQSLNLFEAKRELMKTLIGQIYIASDPDRKFLNTFSPGDINKLCDIFEENMVRSLPEEIDEKRAEELVTGLDDEGEEIDTAATFKDKIIDHHRQNNPIGHILEYLMEEKGVSKSRILRKTIEHADLIHAYFRKYPEVFVISYRWILKREEMHEAVEAVFPKIYALPDIRKYIDESYNKIDPDDEKYGNED
jgi:hypothetical protein